MELNYNNQLGPTDRGAWKINSAENTPNTNKQAITDLYMQDGDDYYIDDNAFSEAQIGTGDNETVASVVGGGGNGSSEANSNVNTGVFGGPSQSAKPGESLWK